MIRRLFVTEKPKVQVKAKLRTALSISKFEAEMVDAIPCPTAKLPALPMVRSSVPVADPRGCNSIRLLPESKLNLAAPAKVVEERSKPAPFLVK